VVTEPQTELPELPAVGSWQATSASRRGSSHGEHGPNQDAVRSVLTALGAEPTWVVAVSDGHGGARYVRSQAGAQLAVDVAVELLVERLGVAAAYDEQLLRASAPMIVDRWRAAVLAHLAEHPFTPDEESVAGGPLYGSPLVAYGATLLVALVSDSGVRLAQIGDGDALVRSHGFAVRPGPGDARLIANATTSLCLDSAPHDFRFAELPDSADADLVLLASDGYGNSFAAQDWWHTLVGDVAWYVDVHGFDAFSSRLPEWLAESALVGGDDVTAAVLTRRLPVHVPASPPREQQLAPASTLPLVEPTPDDRLALPTAHGRRRLVVTAVVAGAIAGACLVGAVLLLTGGDDTPTTPDPPSTVSPSVSETTSPSDGPRRNPRHQPGGRVPPGVQ
jgi:hypothetical protein